MKSKKLMIISLIILAGALVIFGAYYFFARVHSYNTVVHYWKGITVHYPDFDLTFERKDTKPQATTSADSYTYRFSVADSEGTQYVDWRSGTDDHAPTPFEVNGKKFELELGSSESLGKKALKENELVIATDQ